MTSDQSSGSHLFDRVDVRLTVPATHPSPLRGLVVSRLQWCVTIVGGAVASFSAGLSNRWQVLGFGPYHFSRFYIPVSLVLSSVWKEESCKETQHCGAEAQDKISIAVNQTWT